MIKKMEDIKVTEEEKKLFEEKDWGDDGWGLESDILASSEITKGTYIENTLKKMKFLFGQRKKKQENLAKGKMIQKRPGFGSTIKAGLSKARSVYNSFLTNARATANYGLGRGPIG